jgi:uncharacterized protein
MNDALKKKYQILTNGMAQLGSVLVAFSGGIDSTLAARVAHDVLGDRAFAATADSPSLPRHELAETKRLAEDIGIQHLIVNTEEINDPNYVKNDTNRCYFCKDELYKKLRPLAKEHGVQYIINGTNLDDLSDHRPGLVAADEHAVQSPLKTAQLTKADIRGIAKAIGLRIWDKPSSPCLSSRIPYGQQVTPEKLKCVERAENFLRQYNINELRVRHFDDRARIEVHEHDRSKIESHEQAIQNFFKELGFVEYSVSPFKSGSLNILSS